MLIIVIIKAASGLFTTTLPLFSFPWPLVKVHLLQEMEGLIKQVSGAKKESREYRDEISSLRSKNEDLVQQTESLKLKNTEIMGELKLSTKKEQDLRDQNLKLELHFQENTAKLEADVKASKRDSAQQVFTCYEPYKTPTPALPVSPRSTHHFLSSFLFLLHHHHPHPRFCTGHRHGHEVKEFR